MSSWGMGEGVLPGAVRTALKSGAVTSPLHCAPDGGIFSSRGDDLAPLISPNQAACREILSQRAFLWGCPGRIKPGRRGRHSVDMARTALERRSRPFYRALDRSGISGRRRRLHPFLQFLIRQCAGKIPSGASFAGGPPTALGRGVGETGAEEAVRCRCAGVAKGPPPPWPPRFAVSPPGGAWGKLLFPPPPSCRPAPVGPLGAFGAAPSRSRRSENRVVAFFSPSSEPLALPQAPAVRPSWSRARPFRPAGRRAPKRTIFSLDKMTGAE